MECCVSIANHATTKSKSTEVTDGLRSAGRGFDKLRSAGRCSGARGSVHILLFIDMPGEPPAGGPVFMWQERMHARGRLGRVGKILELAALLAHYLGAHHKHRSKGRALALTKLKLEPIDEVGQHAECEHTERDGESH